MIIDAQQIKAVIFDLDGVIYRGQTPLPGAGDVTRWLQARDFQTYYFTNNSTKTRGSYVELLAGYGISTDVDRIVTSASLTARYFTDNGLSRARVLVVGEAGLPAELRKVGVRVVRRCGGKPVDYVVVGMDRKFTYDKLHEAQQAILAGATFIATNRDATYPIEGNVIPGGGSIVAAVATAAEKEPLLIGKPSPEAGKLITHMAGVEPHEALMVGDRLETDIEMGRRAGLLTCLVLTGISTRQEAEALPPESQPHWIVDTIQQVPDILEGRAALNKGAR
jgi:phosphoglycolate/pyridoxal phosphate phosphatase family enzyme